MSVLCEARQLRIGDRVYNALEDRVAVVARVETGRGGRIHVEYADGETQTFRPDQVLQLVTSEVAGQGTLL